jgi:hypothetical protein
MELSLILALVADIVEDRQGIGHWLKGQLLKLGPETQMGLTLQRQGLHKITLVHSLCNPYSQLQQVSYSLYFMQWQDLDQLALLCRIYRSYVSVMCDLHSWILPLVV